MGICCCVSHFIAAAFWWPCWIILSISHAADLWLPCAGHNKDNTGGEMLSASLLTVFCCRANGFEKWTDHSHLRSLQWCHKHLQIGYQNKKTREREGVLCTTFTIFTFLHNGKLPSYSRELSSQTNEQEAEKWHGYTDHMYVSARCFYLKPLQGVVSNQ